MILNIGGRRVNNPYARIDSSKTGPLTHANEMLSITRNLGRSNYNPNALPGYKPHVVRFTMNGSNMPVIYD